MSKLILSAGLLMYRERAGELQIFLAHPGGPFFKNKDLGAWTVPKGEIEPNEDPLNAANREFTEETSLVAQPPFIPLSPVRLKSGKRIQVWAFAGDCDPSTIRSNLFEIEWPPKSGRMATFPEIDRAAFFDVATAKTKINQGQAPLIDELQKILNAGKDHEQK